MNLESCDNCGVVINTDKAKYKHEPTSNHNHGYTKRYQCPACGEYFIKEADKE